MSDAVQILTALVCDEIRREDNGKLIALGIYGTNVKFESAPAASVFSFLVIANVSRPGEYGLEFRAKLDDEVIFGSTGGQVKTKSSGRTVIALANCIVETARSAVLTLESNLMGQGWKFVTSIPVEVPAATTSSTASAPPASQSPSGASKKSSKP